MNANRTFSTHIATSDATSITVRGKDLVGELIGHRTFTEAVFFALAHRMPGPGERACSTPAW